MYRWFVVSVCIGVYVNVWLIIMYVVGIGLPCVSLCQDIYAECSENDNENQICQCKNGYQLEPHSNTCKAGKYQVYNNIKCEKLITSSY